MPEIDVFYRSRPLVLISLGATNTCLKESLNRFEIQKVIFLTLYASSITEIIIQKLNFYFYKRGPYSEIIQRALESLVLEGYVEIIYSEEFYNKTHEDYSLTKKGFDKLLSMKEQYEQYRLLFESSLGICKGISLAGWKNFIDIVYALPDIKDMRWQNIELADKIDLGETTIQQISYVLQNYYDDQVSTNISKFDFYYLSALTLVEYLFSKLNTRRYSNKGLDFEIDILNLKEEIQIE